MALCDFIISSNIDGIDCSAPPAKGAEAMGVLINRADIDYSDETPATSPFMLNFVHGMTKCDTHGYAVYQSGKEPFNGTQQELQEGVYANTITNTLQLVVLKQDEDWAEQLFALVNGEFVAIIKNKNGTEQVFGYEAGLHCTGAVRELYNDDTLSGWQITFTEEGATKGNLFVPSGSIQLVLNGYECH